MKQNKRRTWDHEVTLINQKADEDDAGYPVEDGNDSENTVLANVLSVGRAEYHASNQNGVRTDRIFEVHSFEYNNEKHLIHEGNPYKVLRTYEVDSEIIELYCSDVSQKGVGQWRR